MLIIVSILVFYNEINSKMNIAEIALFVIALIAIVRASLNYIQIDDTNDIKENFASYRPKKRNHKSKMEDITVLNSGDSNEYFDTDKFKSANALNSNNSINNKSTNKSTSEKINNDAVNQVNSLLGLGSSISKFDNISTDTNQNLDNEIGNEIESVFKPQIIIGKGSNDSINTNRYNSVNSSVNSSINSITNNSAEWNTAFSNDGMSFKNTMAPTANLWGKNDNLDNLDNFENNNANWTQSMNDYNSGKWNPQLYQKPSDYTDFYEPSAYGMSSPNTQSTQPTQRSNFESVSSPTNPVATKSNSQGQTKKLCGAYDDLSMEQSGNLVVKQYTQAKKWVPGYTYVPPVYWDVPQRHVSICQPADTNVRKLTGLIDRGLPINALELNPDGSQAQTEDTVTMTNVGSVLPRFNYQEEPYSKPYV